MTGFQQSDRERAIEAVVKQIHFPARHYGSVTDAAYQDAERYVDAVLASLPSVPQEGEDERIEAFLKRPRETFPEPDHPFTPLPAKAPQRLVLAQEGEGLRKAAEADPMPVFVIKAKDNLAVRAIEWYAHECVGVGLERQAAQVGLAVDEIRAWRERHSDLCQSPDHEHVPARAALASAGESAPRVTDEMAQALRALMSEARPYLEPGAARYANPAMARARAVLEAALGAQEGEGLRKAAEGVHHKDGALAQILQMADWIDSEAAQIPMRRETLGKVSANLRAAVEALASAGEPAPRDERDRYWQALVDIAGLENWQDKTAGEIARAALGAQEDERG